MIPSVMMGIQSRDSRQQLFCARLIMDGLSDLVHRVIPIGQSVPRGMDR